MKLHIRKMNADELSKISSHRAHGLAGHFRNLERGSLPTKRSPLYKELRESKVLSDWLDILKGRSREYPRLGEYELSRVSKFGPQGGYPPLAKRMGDLEKYFAPRSDSGYKKLVNSEFYGKLIKDSRRELFGNKHDLRCITYRDAIFLLKATDKLNTNSGAPDYSKRNDKEVISRAIRDAESGTGKVYPAILGSRSSRQKARFIFMFPMSTNLVEMSFTGPIMRVLRDRRVAELSAGEGFDDVTKTINKFLDHSGKVQGYFSMDYSKMDTTVRAGHSAILFDLLGPLFQPKFRDKLKESLDHVNNIPIGISDKEVVTGNHGYASGSGGTNLGESLLSYLVHKDIQRRLGLLKFDQLNGDDGAFGVAVTAMKKEEVISTVIETINDGGFDANADKQDVKSHTFHYLQRFFDDEIRNSDGLIRGSYPTVLALNAAMFPEKFHDPKKWSGDMETLRWIMILENCKDHPMFHEFIDYIIKGDKYGLGTNRQDFIQGLPDLYNEAKKINNFVPTYNKASENRGIGDFEVVKYLKSKK